MREFMRLTALFLFATAAMAAAWGAGFAVSNRVGDVPGLEASSLRSRLPDAVVSGVMGGTDPETAGDSGSDMPSEPVDETDSDDPKFDVFWEAYKVVKSDYKGELPEDEDLTYGAIRGSLRSLQDPYTIFTDPIDTEVQRPDLEGEFEGIGAFVTTNEDGLLTIQTPMRGQPAEQAGIESGDIVIEVDGTDITEMDINEAVLLIRGPKGEPVDLKIVREGVSEPFIITVVRDRIDVPSVADARLLEEEGAPEIGYIQMTVFAAETQQELVTEIEALREAGATALILDVRNNPGGLLSAAIGVTSEFIEDGIVTIREDSRGQRQEERIRGGGSALDIPLVVLINQGSASASEILAGAIRDYERGVLVGETSFGKGSVQNVHELPDGSQLRVTVEIWRTPSGSSIHKKGIEPDVIVTPEPDDPVASAPGGAGPDEASADDGTTQGSDDADDAEDDEAVDPSEIDASQPPDVQLLRAIEEARALVGGGS